MAHSDLDVEQLATYLRQSPQQVTKLAERGEIPGRKVGQSWRFAEAEVHDWLERRIRVTQGEQLNAVQQVVDRWSDSQSHRISLAEQLPVEAIEIPLQARTRSSVIRRVCELAQGTGLLWDAQKMSEAVQAREERSSTALDSGVALLHPSRPQNSILGDPLLVLGRTLTPIHFGNPSGVPTDVFFLICSTDDRLHLQILAKLSRLLNYSPFLADLRQKNTACDAHELLVQVEENLDLADTEA